MRATGATLPLAPGAYSVTLPARLVTNRRPARLRATSCGLLSLVDAPAIVAIGVALPVTSGAYSVIELLAALATKTSPLTSVTTPVGWPSPVAGPLRLSTGEASPVAPVAYAVTDAAGGLAT